jgi:hypothetical protein
MSFVKRGSQKNHIITHLKFLFVLFPRNKTIMFIFTAFTTFFFTMLTLKYSEFFQKLLGVYVDDNQYVEDEMLYGKHPMSDSEDEESEYSELDDDLADFYEETTLKEEWLSKTDDEKKQILDKEIDEYMAQKKQADEIESQLKDIKC